MVEGGTASGSVGNDTTGVLLEDGLRSVDGNGDGSVVDSTLDVSNGGANLVVVSWASSLGNTKTLVVGASTGNAEVHGTARVRVVGLSLLGVGLEVVPGVVVPTTIATSVTVGRGAGDDLLGRVSNGSSVVVDGDDRLNSLGSGESIAATALTLVLDGGALANALGIGGGAPVDRVVIGVAGENLVERSLDSLGAILQKASESFLFLLGHVGDEVVAD